jgi:hypothetical protein
VASGGALFGQKGWQAQDPGTTGNTFNHVSAVNKSVAWVVGNNGSASCALRTLNAGAGWANNLLPGTADLFSCSAVDADGNGLDQIFSDFGSLGLWEWQSGARTQSSGDNPGRMWAANIDADPASELVLDFITFGVWVWNGGAWLQIS